MFQPSQDKTIAPALQGIADEIETRTPGLFVVAAQQFRYPMTQALVDLWIVEPRRFSVLEEFILRSAADLNPSPTIKELAEVLGLDTVFLDKTFGDLMGLNAVEYDDGGRIKLTPLGLTYYEEGQVPQPPAKEQAYFLFDPLLMRFSVQRNALTPVVEEVQQLSDKIGLEASDSVFRTLTLDQTRDILIRSNLTLHDPKQGKIVSQFDLKTSACIMQTVSLFLLYDELEQSWSLQARKGKTRLAGAQELLDQVVREGQDTLLGIFDLSPLMWIQSGELDVTADEDINEHLDRFTKINDLARDALRQERASVEAEDTPADTSKSGEISVLRNEKIRPEFLKLLKSARKEVIVFSPWITEQVVDDEFITLLKELAARNAMVLIGYGINRQRDREDRPLPPNVEKKIHALLTPQGAPAARIVWLGGSHAKEVVVDGKVYLHGSFNWLSYRGDRCVRRETVSRITIPEIVLEAREEYANLFVERAYDMWLTNGENSASFDGLTVICILCSLGRAQEALKLLVDAVRFDLLPDWIRIVTSNLVHGDPLQIMSCLGAAADLFPDIPGKVIDLALFRSAWKAAVILLNEKDSGLAFELIHHPSWKQYPALGLSGEQDSPASYLAAIAKPVSNVVRRKGKKNKDNSAR